mmetsp:Transcript_11348/g.28748  ORF Transcript_11348/g.28748 Transcript_11348/m.28748 type:complete len:241 (+) Transcript_11348:781-1503(+)
MLAAVARGGPAHPHETAKHTAALWLLASCGLRAPRGGGACVGVRNAQRLYEAVDLAQGQLERARGHRKIDGEQCAVEQLGRPVPATENRLHEKVVSGEREGLCESALSPAKHHAQQAPTTNALARLQARLRRCATCAGPVKRSILVLVLVSLRARAWRLVASKNRRQACRRCPRLEHAPRQATEACTEPPSGTGEGTAQHATSRSRGLGAAQLELAGGPLRHCVHDDRGEEVDEADGEVI